jgi:hypothetical protein
MPKLRLVTIGLLLLHLVDTGEPGSGAISEKLVESLSPAVKSRLLSRKVHFIGCYSAVFTLREVVVPRDATDCTVTCKKLQEGWKGKFTKSGMTMASNICIASRKGIKYGYPIGELGGLPDDHCKDRPQCSCSMTIAMPYKFLSPDGVVEADDESQAEGLNSKAFAQPAASSSSKLKPPSNCNATGFAEWLARKVAGSRPLQVTFTDVKIDLECEPFIRRFSGMTDQQVIDAFEQAKIDVRQARARKRHQTGTMGYDQGPSMKRVMHGDVCQRDPSSVDRPDDHTGVCRTGEEAGMCMVRGPAQEGTSSAAQEVDVLMHAIASEQMFLHNLFPLKPDLFQDNDGETDETEQ